MFFGLWHTLPQYFFFSACFFWLLYVVSLFNPSPIFPIFLNFFHFAPSFSVIFTQQLRDLVCREIDPFINYQFSFSLRAPISHIFFKHPTNVHILFHSSFLLLANLFLISVLFFFPAIHSFVLSEGDELILWVNRFQIFFFLFFCFHF